MNGMERPQLADEATWETRVPLLTNPFIVYDAVKATLISAAIFLGLIGLCCAFLDDYEPVAAVSRLMVISVPGILLLLALVCLVFFPRGFPARFWITSKGVSWDFTISKRGAAAANPLSPAAATAAGRLRWREILAVHEHQSRRVICLRNNWRVVIRLYCLPENYETCVRLIRKNTSS